LIHLSSLFFQIAETMQSRSLRSQSETRFVKKYKSGLSSAPRAESAACRHTTAPVRHR